MTFGLNALIGRKKSKTDDTLWEGDWNTQNARDLMKYTISKGYKIESYEFGINQDCNRIFFFLFFFIMQRCAYNFGYIYHYQGMNYVDLGYPLKFLLSSMLKTLWHSKI